MLVPFKEQKSAISKMQKRRQNVVSNSRAKSSSSQDAKEAPNCAPFNQEQKSAVPKTQKRRQNVVIHSMSADCRCAEVSAIDTYKQYS